ncbi:hypothetical protein I8748_16885 [Nostoc sp. CENA67]|uniref:Uncharacterized protein n=1 Tax=Amazonocrinis nigriterrae CENA67 TaxID=2794033 RepID=A0A8J7HQ27_9NOST|nr:hormogonium polysaccharide biosynthesis protein HpsA [Amazonocrinis nigriterrae]MBH8563846.1 hypothetical protein [Amazonocrinis nigriterrae CENA67]
MFRKRQLAKTIKIIFKQFSKTFLSSIKKPIIWLLRTLFITKRRRGSLNAGFVLPTVAMVALVVILLTTAILFRSFERSKNANNVRVNQAVISSASPALERAKAKIDKLFQDPKLPRSTPADFSLYQVMTSSINQYTFGDETQLKLVYDINNNSSIQTNTGTLDTEETLTTAWKYPVDTNNDGKFDSFTLYGIYFRSPLSSRPRSPLEARTPPMNENNQGSQCTGGSTTSAQLVGTQGWFKRAGTLKRGIFVYTTTVPITNITGLDANKYQPFKGNKGFAALEYEQDRERVPLSNNAVLYNDDLEIAPGDALRLNGRIVTNGNLLTGQRFSSEPIQLFLVSSPKSCYYDEANSKIIVGGNVANGRVIDAADINNAPTTAAPGTLLHYFKESGPQLTRNSCDTTKYDPAKDCDFNFINTDNKSVTNSGGSDIAYNSKAYEMRIQLLVDAAMLVATLPQEVTQEITRQTTADASLDATTVKKEQLEIYFRKRTRRVPYAEVNFGQEVAKAIKNTVSADYTTSDVLQGSGTNDLRPPDKWMYPYDPTNGTTHTGYSNLPIKTQTSDTTKIFLPATATKFPEPQGDEGKIGDRVVAGNGLPEIWWNGTKFVSQLDGLDSGQTISGKVWDATGSGTDPRKRFPQVHQLDDLGITERDDFWEKKAAEQAQGSLDVVGGLRVVTGAGIYLPTGFTPTTTDFSTALPTVWSDSMAVATTTTEGLPSDKTPYLQMRATAVYHYTQSAFNPQSPSTNPQTPIACVSSFYDPTSSTTARNKSSLPDVSRLTDTTGTVTANPGNSNNGVVYAAPSKTKTDYAAALTYQASLKYPNGRLVNEPLKKALDKGSGNLTLSDKSALDSAICALELLDSGVTKTPTNTVIPHGAIKEVAFLDARQVKAITKPGSSDPTEYNLDVEQRQPLEIRATVLDLNLLRGKAIGTGEFLLPNSGIIYATRDDALGDASDSTSNLSATDFKLDSTRRPGGIMLINGSNISRNSTYKPEEKGLILATNLPAYIKGNFNTHSQEEFISSQNLATDWNNFYGRTTLNDNFACRPGQFTTCTTGETWRSATVIADSITILSGNFKEGFRNEGDYDLRDNAPPLRGYDYDGNDTIGTNTVTLNETTLQLDLNNDDVINNTSITALNETTLGVDLNNDGDTSDTAVTIIEQNIPSVVARRLNGFWDNNFVTSFPWKPNGDDNGNPIDLSTSATLKSSYFNNFVTPVQRRTSFPEYVMELCHKPTVSACKPSDWSVGYLTGGAVDWDYKATDLGTKRILTNDTSFTVDKLGAGTTARPALNATDQRFPRRVAFLRDTSGNLLLTGTSPNRRPIPLGIKGTNILGLLSNDNPTPDSTDDKSGQVAYYSYDTYSSTNRPRLHSRALWFRTAVNPNTSTPTPNYGYNYPLWIMNRDGIGNTKNTDQPLLIPVLQIQYPFGGSGTDLDTNTLNTGSSYTRNIKDRSNTWLQNVTDPTTETNVAFVQGDTPGRPKESNGGLENFVRYLENWNNRNHKIAGAFIQYKRSSYATAPFQTFMFTGTYSATNGYSSSTTAFGYPQGYRTTVNTGGASGATLGRTPFYVQPNRAWGFDVALLTQLPDLFSQRFTSPTVGDPNEYYREVGRDDPWVKTLLCGAQTDTTTGFDNAAASYGTGFKYALSSDQRPTCP